MKNARTIIMAAACAALSAACAALMAGCDGASLKVIIQGLIAREQLGLIQEITIHSAGDTLQMGDPSAGPEAAETLSHDFTISRYEITNAQYGRFIAAGGYSDPRWWTTNGWAELGADSITSPRNWSDTAFNAPDQPVSGVNWYEAVAFCNWRSVQEGLDPVYDKNGKADMKANGYRLPTEVEWEYAAAKGAPGQAERLYPYGDTADDNKEVDWISHPGVTAVVGSHSPAGDTREGVADMAGNVYEWCSDNYDALPPSSSTDRYIFLGDDISNTFMLRGGSCNYDSTDSASAYRGTWQDPRLQQDALGFRIVRTL